MEQAGKNKGIGVATCAGANLDVGKGGITGHLLLPAEYTPHRGLTGIEDIGDVLSIGEKADAENLELVNFIVDRGRGPKA